MRIRPLTFACLLAAGLSGCGMLGPNYAKPELAVPAAWSGPHASGEREDLSHWWQRLDDALLTALVTTALQRNPDLHAAQAALREARARRALAGAERFPTLTAGVSGSRSRSGGMPTQRLYDAGFDAGWEPDVFGAQRRDLEAAEAELQAGAAGLHHTRVSLAAEVALNYIELRSAQQRLAIARHHLATQADTLQIADWRAQAGLSTRLDVERALTSLEQTRATLPTLEQAQAEARHRLAVLTGEAPAALDAQLAAAAPLPQPPEQVAAGIPADTLRQRPDVQAAERRLAAATARIGSAMAERWPQFSLSGSFGWKAAALRDLGSPGTVASALVAGMMGTLFDGGRIASRIEIQNAVQQQALAAYEQSVLDALEDVENALAAYAASRERQATLRRAAQSAHSAATLARQLYESGNSDFQPVLDAERSRLAIEDSLASAEAQGLTALVQLYKALGGGWQDTTDDTEQTAS